MMICILTAYLFVACKKSSSNPIEVVTPIIEERGIYVSTQGSDSNKGTKDSPFKTINLAVSKAVAGDTVFVREGVYTEKVSITRSGQNNRPVVLKSFPGETGRIDGTGLSIVGSEGLIHVKGANNIVIEHLHICNYITSIPGGDVTGIIVSDGSDNVSIQNNKVYKIQNLAAPELGRNAHAIHIIGNTSDPMKNIKIEGNEVYDTKTGYSESVTVNGYVDGFLIANNTIHDCENIAIVAAGGYAANAIPTYNYVRNGVIRGNEVYNIDGTTGPIPAYANGQHGAPAIYVDGARDVIVEQNIVYNSDRGIGIVSENNDFPTENCIVRNNVLHNNYLCGIYLGGYLNFTGGGTKNCYVLNNTLYKNNRALGYFDEIEGEIRLTEGCVDNIIANNLIFARENSVFVHKYTATGSNNTFNNNLYYADNGGKWIWEGVDKLTFDDWKSASQSDQNTLFNSDPLFVNATTFNFQLQNGSPAKDKGGILANSVYGAFDFNGNVRVTNSKINIGAFQ